VPRSSPHLHDRRRQADGSVEEFRGGSRGDPQALAQADAATWSLSSARRTPPSGPVARKQVGAPCWRSRGHLSNSFNRDNADAVVFNRPATCSSACDRRARLVWQNLARQDAHPLVLRSWLRAGGSLLVIPGAAAAYLLSAAQARESQAADQVKASRPAIAEGNTMSSGGRWRRCRRPSRAGGSTA
jgi:hypothetical protein